ncbi:MAG: DHHA1 domain-containing protein, partial [Solirubrobacterales bacterium]
RFDFTHSASLSAEDLHEIENRVNEWVKASRPVRAMQMSRADAEALGAMALFGEKYGEWVRMIEVDDVSRELCGGTHVANTAEIGIFTIASEGSSAANVRRIEALTGPAAIDHFRERAAALEEAGSLLGSRQDPLGAARRAAERLEALERQASEAAGAGAKERAAELAAEAADLSGVKLVAATVDGVEGKALQELAERIKSALGPTAAIVLGSAEGEGVALVASFGKDAVAKGLNAGEVIREAAAIVGGGGGGREDFARAGGKDAGKLGDAVAAARAAIEAALSNS